jgi:type IV secretion system protein VirB11
VSNRVLARSLVSFQACLDNPDTTDIVVNRPGEVGVKTGGAWSWYDEPFLTYDRLDAIAILTAFHTGQDIDEVHPLCSTTLPNGERLQICRSPVTAPGTISLSIRRPPSFGRHWARASSSARRRRRR